MTKRTNVYQIVIAGLLCAIGILIPMFSPIKILLEPASFTLASHVAVFIAMFMSPSIAAFVSVGTTLGFLFGGFPIVIVARAATHVIFATIGALILRKKPQLLDSFTKTLVFALLIGTIHGLSEVLVVTPFYMSNAMTTAYYAKGYFTSVALLVGVGSLIHSTVDFYIALLIWKPLKKAAKR